MPAADIEINGVAGSNDDLPLNTLVQFSNADTGGEVTYFWELLDAPLGSVATLSNAAIENPTFTPDKEGSYLFKLTVNDALASEVTDTAIVGVRQLRTRQRIPAALETLEVDPALGWKPAVNAMLQLADFSFLDGNLVLVKMPSAAVPSQGGIIRISGAGDLENGETVLVGDKALATSASQVAGPLMVVVIDPLNGVPTADQPAWCRRYGLVELGGIGAPALGDPIYVSDTGTASLVVGTNPRQIGKVVKTGGGVYRWMIDGSIAW